jgi:His/Glu/Gln/Arg/opine family amino acid ABC transporter permease subunit
MALAIDWPVIEMAVPLLAQGTLVTLQISISAILLGTLGGVLLGVLSLSSWPLARLFVRAYVDFIRGTPLLVQIFLVFFALPVLGIRLSETWSGIAALSINCAGYVAEIVRGTVGSVEQGQSEAAKSIGMTRLQIIHHILLPQAFRPIIPPLTNELISLVKNSSLLSVIAVYELTRSGQAIIATYFAPFEIYALIALYYYVIVSVLAFLSRLVERRLPVW